LVDLNNLLYNDFDKFFHGGLEIPGVDPNPFGKEIGSAFKFFLINIEDLPDNINQIPGNYAIKLLFFIWKKIEQKGKSISHDDILQIIDVFITLFHDRTYSEEARLSVLSKFIAYAPSWISGEVVAKFKKHPDLQEVNTMWESLGDILIRKGKIEGAAKMLAKIVDFKYKDKKLTEEMKSISNLITLEELFSLALKWDNVDDFRKRCAKLPLRRT
jgi:hypothetical protein